MSPKVNSPRIARRGSARKGKTLSALGERLAKVQPSLASRLLSGGTPLKGKTARVIRRQTPLYYELVQQWKASAS